ncbi:MAG TPA: methyltransferase domain-containing protein [Candidatus Hydrogenedentes bacterium]|nr:methyltransferase domain-containing protein [Candidatus Hydrogenedentota bacterium]
MNREEYERMYRVEDTHWWYRSLHALVEDFLGAYPPPPPSANQHRPASRALIDIGCGTGALLNQLDRHGQVFGIDLAPEALACCRKRSRTRLAQASAMALPFPAENFQAAFMMDVLYHLNVADPMTPLREAHRVLQPGGLLFVNVPAYAWLYSSHDHAVHTARRFTRTQLVEYLQQAGFEAVRISYWNSLLFPIVAAVRLARKWMPNRGSDLPEEGGSALNTPLLFLLSVERFLIRRCSLPFGLSIFAVAEKQLSFSSEEKKETKKSQD